MKRKTLLLTTALLVSFSLTARASNPAPEPMDPQPAKVMLFGVFHFENPGLDHIKADKINVLTEESQAYLEKLTGRLGALSPTHVLLECEPADQAHYDRLYADYRAGEHQLNTNENQQLGFRIAASAGLDQVTCYDEQEVSWQPQPLFKYMEQHATDRKQRVEKEISRITALIEQRHSTLSLRRLLQLTNDPAEDQVNINLYMATNDIGAGDGFAGADAAASWWHRNLRMYANIQAVAQPGSRVIAIGGQGHTALLKTLIAADSAREAWDITEHL
ncbi:DUF5694 domain-containing protein [Microbulbifer yueqingensis]|uniref:Haem-binding uptake, Tiki superfamily, ChaN n=1 Tax=Microbulbifer yueqingensis TaxID=658219 RepID=A0A1G9DIE1_9GAMM|nr:DUF5694 domain-containing protein [Microbulbifer yueqingensis]SDK63616.1 hypothetical protein SAMN05216212_2819 [Microbulbifer yueqingensis]